MKRSLNLDGMFIPTSLPEIEFTMHKFSGGELHIKLNNNIDYSNVDSVVITHRIKSSDDLIMVLIAKDALERKGIMNFELIIPYIPYARQDRQCFNGESFTLKIFTDILNSVKFNKVTVFDAHSDVSPALINNCVNIANNSFVIETFNEIIRINGGKDVLLISPDAGSNKKCNKLHTDTKLFKDLVKCDKKRNVQDGSLSGFEVFANDLNGLDCLIVDDICDGGGTFIGLAQELKKKNCGNLYLLVTHSIMPNGTSKLKEVFDGIYSTNSFRDIEDIKQFKIQL